MLIKVTASIDEEACKRLDKYVEKQMRNRSNAIEYLLMLLLNEEGEIKDLVKKEACI